MAFDPTGKFYFAYRDAHNGQFAMQDYNASDVELWEGTSIPPTTPTCLAQGGNNKVALDLIVAMLERVLAES